MQITKLTKQLAEMKTASQKVIAENKILRKLAEVPENYDFDYDEVIIAD